MSRICSYRRRPTREVSIGDLKLGGNFPIRVQSMTISKTTDVEATVAEVIELANVGCEIVRVTVPTIKDAEAVKDIKAQLRAKNCNVPLCADIHFMPAAALKVADYVEKVRINPGNYADTKRFAVREYTDTEYKLELERIYEKFSPLVLKLKENGGALRVGTNHGSLSDRIMNRFGDSPEGMVESAMEFLRMCEDLNFRNIVISMKSSNPVVMIQAYRLLAEQLEKENMPYPFHLGVTEAGDGFDGRIKSSIGIGNLLLDGLGDTVRVSLTENSVYEIPVCQKLVAPFNDILRGGDPVALLGSLEASPKSVGDATVQDCKPILPHVDLHGRRPVGRFTLQNFSHGADLDFATTSRLPVRVEVSSATSHVPASADTPIEIVHLHNGIIMENSMNRPSEIIPVIMRPGMTSSDLLSVLPANQDIPLELVLPFQTSDGIGALEHFVGLIAEVEAQQRNVRISLSGEKLAYATRALDVLLRARQLKTPLVISYKSSETDREKWLVEFSRDCGGLFADGIGESLYVDATDSKLASEWAYSLLQASRTRISKTDFISCPSCGRTLFDLQTTTERIKSKVGHLKGLKVAIMGCIVNGPGEMADADFGYVGWGPGKINLYVGRECVERNINEDEADERLIELIKRHGRWVEPVVLSNHAISTH